jgi:hypothetical protein
MKGGERETGTGMSEASGEGKGKEVEGRTDGNGSGGEPAGLPVRPHRASSRWAARAVIDGSRT